MHTYTSSSWGMQVDDLRLMLNRKWTEIYEGILHFIIFSQNHSLNLHVVATCWTISACTVNNISIISFIKKKTLLDDQEKHILVNCNFLLNTIFTYGIQNDTTANWIPSFLGIPRNSYEFSKIPNYADDPCKPNSQFAGNFWEFLGIPKNS